MKSGVILYLKNRMALLIIAVRPFLHEVLSPRAPLLKKIQDEGHRLGISKDVQKAYRSHIGERGMALLIPNRAMEDVMEKLQREERLIQVAFSEIKAKIRGLEIGRMEEKYRKFVELAVALRADYLISEASAHHKYSYELERDFGIKVVRPDKFLKPDSPT